jgi:hypothetical protein
VEHLECTVAAPVVHEHDLMRPPGNGIEHRTESSQELRNSRLLVVEGDGD